jgi:Sulfate permease family
VQIGGPTGAFVVIVYGIVQKFGVDGLIVATIMAGIFLIVLGAVKLGSVIKFIPHGASPVPTRGTPHPYAQQPAQLRTTAFITEVTEDTALSSRASPSASEDDEGPPSL